MGILRKIKGLWSVVFVELTNACNFSCEFCPSDFLKRKREFMSRELWEKILRELAEKKMTNNVIFHLLGEPLLHKDIFDAIRFANNRGLSVCLVTNGSLLDEDRGDKLLDSLERGQINLSLQNTLSDNFDKRCHGFLSWEDYIGRLQKFMLKAQSRGKSVRVSCMVDILSMSGNFQKIRQEQKIVRDVYNQWSRVLGTRERRRINILNPEAVYPFAGSVSFSVKHRNRWSNQFIGEGMEVGQSDKGYCVPMTGTFAVLADGTCTFCCNDYEGRLNLGRFPEASLEDIFYGEKATRIREAGKCGKMIEAICKTCCGRVVYKKNKKPVPSRNLISEFYFFLDHFKGYGLLSAYRKVVENLRRRMMRDR